MNSRETLVSKIKAIQNEIGSLETNYHMTNLNTMMKRFDAENKIDELIPINKRIKIETEKLKTMTEKCKGEESALKQQIEDTSSLIKELRNHKNKVNKDLTNITSKLEQDEKNLEPKLVEARRLKTELNSLLGKPSGNIKGNPPTPPGPRNNRPGNNLPSTPSSGSGATKFALAANAALAKNRLNQSMGKKNKSVITNTTRPVKEQVKNWDRQSNVRSSLNSLSKSSPTKAGAAIRGAAGKVTGLIRKFLPGKKEQMEKRNNEIKSQLPPVKIPGKFKRTATGAVAIESMKPKIDQVPEPAPVEKQEKVKGTYANATRTNPSVQQPPPVTAPTGTQRPNTSAIRMLGNRSGDKVMTMPTRRPVSARNHKGRANPPTNGNKNATRLIYGKGNSHQGLIKQASSKTGTALNGSSKKGTGTQVVQQAWGSPRTSVTSATTTASRGKIQERSPRAGPQVKAHSGTGGGKTPRPGSASQPSSPRSSFSIGRPGSAPATPTGGRGPKRKAKRPHRSTQVGFKRK